MKKVFIVFFVISLFFFTSCGGKNVKKYNNKVLIFWHSMGGVMGRVLNNLIDEYNGTNPEYRIVPKYKGNYSALIQSILAGIPAHSLPDISQAYESWTSKLIDNDIIVPLQPYFDELTQEERDDFFPIFIKNNTFGKTLWSIPFNKSVPVMYYNKEMFKKYGIEPPKKWNPISKESEFDTVCKMLTVDDDGDGIPNQTGYAFNISVMMWECFLYQAGGSLTDPTGKTPVFNEQAGVDAIKWWKSLMDRKYAFKTQGFDFQNNFASGNVGMIMTSCVSKFYMKNKLTFEMGITSLPYYKHRAVILSGTNLVVVKSTEKRQRAAWKFLKWLTSPEITAKWSVNTNYLPIRRSSMDTEIMKKALAEDPYLMVPIDELEYAYFEPQSSGWYNSRNIISEAIEMILLGITGTQKGLDDAAKKIKPELNK
ncbi:ABC transporter substrate-binding protein [bacterium]|nr:ABC transporter substrate-binding protein [bacterium]